MARTSPRFSRYRYNHPSVPKLTVAQREELLKMEDLLELDTILLFRRFVAWQMSQLHGEGPARDAYLGLSLSWKELRCEGEKALHDQSLVVSEDELFELFALQVTGAATAATTSSTATSPSRHLLCSTWRSCSRRRARSRRTKRTASRAARRCRSKLRAAK